MRRTILAVSILVVTTGALATPAGGAAFPDEIPVPTGSYPEGIAVGAGTNAYVSSLLNGSVYAFDLRTGEGAVLVEGQPGRATAGLAVDDRSGLLWAVGLGELYAFDTRTGDEVATVSVPGQFINDLAVTRTAVHITDSFDDVLWSVPLDNRGLPAGPAVSTPLTGDFELVETGELPVNLNGLVATSDGRTLVGVHSTLGFLYRIDPATGATTKVDLGGDVVPFGDGLVRVGHTVYVVQNFLNRIAKIELAPDLTSGQVVDVITDPAFRVPATAAVFGHSLYAVNARFDEAFPPIFGAEPQMLDYEVVRVDR